MKKQTIKNLTLIRLLQTFLLSIIIIMIIMFLGYRHFFSQTVEDKALEISRIVKAGLTSHMKAGIMDKRGYFLDEIRHIDNINSIEILRGESVTKQFGKSSLSEKMYSPYIKQVEKTKQAFFNWNYPEGNVIAVIPYIANSKEKLNCLNCHDTTEGTVLGAIELDMDISSYQTLIANYSYIFIALLIFLALVIIFNMFNFMENYIAKPLSSIINDGANAYKFHNNINTDNYAISELETLAENFNDFNHEVISKEEELQQRNKDLEELNQEIELTLRDTMQAMGEIEEVRSSDTKNHTKRVSILSAKIAEAYGLSEDEVKLIKLTSPLHDIGKVGISDAILLKPEKLTHDEYEEMKKHAELGYRALKHSKRLVLRTAATIAHSHHERYDGKGYPQGLKEEEIPLLARIVAIVDVLDALLCERIYKDAWTSQKVKDFIKDEKGKHFDPILADIVLENFDEYAQIIKELTPKT